jgi:hypothetical protein
MLHGYDAKMGMELESSDFSNRRLIAESFAMGMHGPLPFSIFARAEFLVE